MEKCTTCDGTGFVVIHETPILKGDRRCDNCEGTGEIPILVRCDQCSASTINGYWCHESGCPNDGKEYENETGNWLTVYTCKECGSTYHDKEEYQKCCNEPEEFDNFEDLDEAEEEEDDYLVTMSEHALKLEDVYP